MNLILFTHPQFLDSTSMPLFANFIKHSVEIRGHNIETWFPKPFFYNLPASKGIKKWLGYVDQFIVFPVIILFKLLRTPKNSLFIFADQALGPWVPFVANRPHVIHCHDFLALRSSLNEFPQNPVSFSGKIYQKMIRSGFNKGKNFISVSNKTRKDLHRFLTEEPLRSEVVYNCLNYPFRQISMSEANKIIKKSNSNIPSERFILHIGGNQWYKNRKGVLDIYKEYCDQAASPLPLVIIGAEPTEEHLRILDAIPRSKVFFTVNPPTEVVEAAYSIARILLFPSISEGFGWPIIEAMACGCRVLTTDEAPMTEVGGDFASYLPIPNSMEAREWNQRCAEKLLDVLNETEDENSDAASKGIQWANRFNAERTTSSYLQIYRDILSDHNL